MLPKQHAFADAEGQLRQACVEMLRSLRAGEACRSEDLLAKYPALASDPRLSLELIHSEFLYRVQLGQSPDPTEWYDRFPDRRNALEQRFQTSTPPEMGSAGAIATVPEMTTPPEPAWEAPGTHVGRRFGRYILGRELGRGGMGVVYKAHDTLLERDVALKLLRGGILSQQEEIERFYREAKTAAKLDHPNIITILDFGAIGGESYYTMAYIAGTTLARRMANRDTDVRAAVDLLVKIARAVHYAHQMGIVHRDLKPANVLLDDNHQPRVGDFGLAKLLQDDPELTRSGQVLGTPSYMAPEQAQGRASHATARSDVWALGVILYELLAGRRPFLGKTSHEITQNIILCDPPTPRSLSGLVDRSLETIVLKCLEKDPARRYATAAELADDLSRWQRGEPIHARPEGRVHRAWRNMRRHPLQCAAAVLVLATVVGVPLAAHYGDPDRPRQEIVHQLRLGQPARLIGDTGGPIWSQPVFGIPEIDNVNADRKPFSLGSAYFCILELLADPQVSHFRYSAEVCHEVDNTGSKVGLYFCDSRHATARGTEFCCLALVFDDLVASSVSELDPAKALKMRADVCSAWIHMNVASTKYPGIMGPPLQAIQYPPRGPTQQWHRLAVDVGPEFIIAFWDDAPLGAPQSRKELLKRNEEIFFLRPGLAPKFASRGGLGLIVRNGRALFRNVVLEPLP